MSFWTETFSALRRKLNYSAISGIADSINLVTVMARNSGVQTPLNVLNKLTKLETIHLYGTDISSAAGLLPTNRKSAKTNAIDNSDSDSQSYPNS